MDDSKLEKNIKFYEELSSVVYSPEYWESLKYKGEFFLKLYEELQQIPEKGVPVMKVFEFKHKLWTTRLLLGIGCELILKSSYLKKGFLINKPFYKILPSKLKDKAKNSFPLLYSDFGIKKINRKLENAFKTDFSKRNKENLTKEYIENYAKKMAEKHIYINPHQFYSFNTLIRRSHTLFPDNLDKEFINEKILLGMHITRIWRNTHAHSPLSPYSHIGDENQLINESLRNIYKFIFNEKFEVYQITQVFY